MRWVALTGLVALVLAAVLAGPLTGQDPIAQHLGDRLLPPGTAGHLLGTDDKGRDVLARTLYGARVSLLVGFVAATAASAFGMLLGLLAGYYGGWADRLITRAGDVWIAFPFLVLAVATLAVAGSDLWILVSLLALAGWVTPTRVTRSLVRRLRGADHVQAAIGLGAGDARVIRRHVLPAVLPANLVVWTLTVGTLILIEGGLSFLGLGVRPPTPSWGNMLNDGRGFLEIAWWMTAAPGVALTLTVLLTNLLGDALRDRLDVRLRDR
ncbi:ABC transporter permease [Dactylosporangium sp. NPDC005572]|uniref:ABC transporter permease n=1 Tax=Dactylosporangium sp. NPDC005572 TaxID=3156889 RepID=UPI0033BCD441